ncbi:MAG: 3-deoxy-manno-octulosonate cytidylyltransferase [Opitutae bacterium]
MADSSPLPTIIVPARLASSRFPRKLLADAGGVPLILRTANRLAEQVPEYELIFAVDGDELAKPLEQNGFSCIFTDPDLPSGTDRIAFVNQTLQREEVLNVQADEPMVTRDHILGLSRGIRKRGADLATLATPFASAKDFHDPNQVKVVMDRDGFALFFSRSPVPYDRDANGDLPHAAFKHLGMYAYRRTFLNEFIKLPHGILENLEKLEQLRALENGRRISVEVIDQGSIGVDTEEDLALLSFQ